MSVPTYNSLSFDSSLFDFPVASICLENPEQLTLLANTLEGNMPTLFYLFSSMPLSVEAIERKTGYFVGHCEERVVFERCVESAIDIDGHIALNKWQVEDVSHIYQLGLASGEYSRFALDSKFPRGSFEKLYDLWVDKSLRKELADDVFLFKKDNVKGLLTVKYVDEMAKVGLVAVSKDSRGLGIGGKLLNGLESRAFQLNKHKIIIPTQRINKNACRFYANSGYKELKSSFIYHCWRSNG